VFAKRLQCCALHDVKDVYVRRLMLEITTIVPAKGSVSTLCSGVRRPTFVTLRLQNIVPDFWQGTDVVLVSPPPFCHEITIICAWYHNRCV